MFCIEYYCKRYLLIEGCHLEEASEESFHSGNKSSFLIFFLHDLVYVWYFSAKLGISVLHFPPYFPQPCVYFIVGSTKMLLGKECGTLELVTLSVFYRGALTSM